MQSSNRKLLILVLAGCISLVSPSATLLFIASVCAFIGYIAPRGNETLSTRLSTQSVLKLAPLLLALWVPFLLREWLF